MGKGRNKEDERKEHVSQPLSSLRDPASFGPPPKRSTTSASDRSTTTLDRSPSYRQPRDIYDTDDDEPRTPRLPSRTTSSSAKPAPPPPVRRRNDSPTDSEISGNSRPRPSAPPPPRLPPRLPPRSTPSPSVYSSNSQPEGYLDGELNQESTSRLSRAGVSVPALGIGGGGGGGSDSPASNTASQAPVNELQARFAQMSARGSSSSSVSEKHGAPPPPPSRHHGHTVNVYSENPSRKKAPPPPPPKKQSIRVPQPNGEQTPAPPPVPIGTKPR